jgi:hypothetical protein
MSKKMSKNAKVHLLPEGEEGKEEGEGEFFFQT